MLSHLPPSTISNISLISRRFHQLVTAPHAWRSAFSRFFPGVQSVDTMETNSDLSKDDERSVSDRRLFARLSPLASWRSEYILRTRLLQSLARGKPADISSTGGATSSRTSIGQSVNAQVTYSSGLTCPIDHLHASFGANPNRKYPRFIHGSGEIGMASTSDPRSAKADSWGFQDTLAFRQFQDLFPGEAEYGLGAGDLVGLPNVMDVSQSFGMIYGEGHQSDSILWFRHSEEKRGRALLRVSSLRVPEIGIPKLPDNEAICSVWIARNRNLPHLTDGMIGIMAGSSTGVLTAYSLGTTDINGRKLARGEITARWIVSPGVPIVSISVDECVSSQRQQSRRIWVAILNALGEVYYLTELPTQPEPQSLQAGQSPFPDLEYLERTAWAMGRATPWKLIEPTRRVARIDPFSQDADGSYSPHPSSHDTHLNQDQLVAETVELESFLNKKPKHFRKVCHGWDMCRVMQVDFAATGKYNAGEVIVVIARGLGQDGPSHIRRYTRHKIDDCTPKRSQMSPVRSASSDSEHKQTSHGNIETLFGRSSSPSVDRWSFARLTSPRRGSATSSSGNAADPYIEEWRTSNLDLDCLQAPQITASAIDVSAYATLTAFEDPLISLSGSSNLSSPASSPLISMAKTGSQIDVPGDRGRLLAVGTKGGKILLYDMRSAVPMTTKVENSIKPLRMIYTESPQVSCLALSALYLVHGGNDGLVQAWDPLASSTVPFRTLNSRFSSRARRRLVQAEASPTGVGVNLFAAGAIWLDQDPTILRGMVSLGSHLRFWSYSSDAADQYRSSKRRLRRAERSSNQGTDKFSGTGRGALRDYIANEKLDLEREKKDKRKENERLVGRFGIDLLGPGASEDEIMAYATMLSEEAAENDELRRKSASSSSDADPSPVAIESPTEQQDELAKAVYLSLQSQGKDTESASSSIPIRKAKSINSATSVDAQTGPPNPMDTDLDYAIQLSLAEQESKNFLLKSKGKEREV